MYSYLRDWLLSESVDPLFVLLFSSKPNLIGLDENRLDKNWVHAQSHKSLIKGLPKTPETSLPQCVMVFKEGGPYFDPYNAERCKPLK